MADDKPKIAENRVWKENQNGLGMTLVAAPGDEMPPEGAAAGYEEKIDLRADTADAKIAKGEDVPTPAERHKVALETAAAERAEYYADPLPKVGEEGNELIGEVQSSDSDSGSKAKRSSSVEDKSKKG